MAFSNEDNQVMLKQARHDNLCRRVDFVEVEASDNQLLIITSSRSKDRDVVNCMAQIFPGFAQNFTTEKLSSAIKFFRLLEGDADLYLHFRPSMEWDTAAGQALVEMLGGEVKKLTRGSGVGENLTYKKTTFENSPFVAFISQNVGHLVKVETQ